VGAPITEWKQLLDPKFKGKAAILDVPNIGIMDAALALESRGEIDVTINAACRHSDRHV
jgi:putative spermidine/putrescine transport system substrate-binding protein